MQPEGVRLRARVWGGGREGGGLAEAAAALEGFLADPWLLRPAAAGEGGGGGGGRVATVQVEVPPVEAAEEGRRRPAGRRAAAGGCRGGLRAEAGGRAPRRTGLR